MHSLVSKYVDAPIIVIITSKLIGFFSGITISFVLLAKHVGNM